METTDKKVEVAVSVVARDSVEVAKGEKRLSDFDAESQLSSLKSLEKKKRESKWSSCGTSGLFARVRHGRLPQKDDTIIVRSKRRRCCTWVLATIVVLSIFGAIAAIIYITFVHILISRLSPPTQHSGLSTIAQNWRQPDANGAYKFDWPEDFSRDIVQKNCHSHNDYWRTVPLYDALAAGCSSIEADVWLSDDKDLRVGHTWKSTTQYRTLRNLYLDPLTTIFKNRNASITSENEREIGVFDADPNASIVLLIDMKTDGHKIWPVLQAQLQPLRERNWLTYYDGKNMHYGPLTVVGSGQTPFELVQQNATERWIFYDASLMAVSSEQFDSTNSYYASAKFSAAVSTLWLGRFSAKQEAMLKSQIQAAAVKGLKSRYYGTPAWPIGLRDRVWGKLMDLGVGVLNVDDLVSATRWNWGLCVVAGFVLCGDT